VRIFLLDAHNEYDKCFNDKAQVLNPANLRLPFLLFSFEEMIDVIFGGRPGIEEETEILAGLIPMAKAVSSRPYLAPSDSRSRPHTRLPALQLQKSRPSSCMKRASTMLCTSEAPSTRRA